MGGKGIVTGLVGGVAGFFIGGPAGAVIGFAAGMAVGAMVDATTPDAVDTPGASQTQSMDISTAGYGDPLPDFLGTVKVAGNIIQYWGHRVVEVTEQQSVPGAKGGGGEETQTVVVGYQHYLSWVHALAYGPDPAGVLHSILFDDKVVWYGELTDDDADGEETVQLGSESGENLGSMTFYFGTSNQAPNAKATAALSNANYSSAYRGMVYACFDDVMIGDYARAPSVKFVMSKWPSIAAIGSDSLAKINDIDYNAAFAIWYLAETLSGVPTAFLNAASFTAAAGYFQATDYVGISMLISRQVVAESYVEGIMTHVGASLSEIEGELHLGVLRDDVDIGSMGSIDDAMVAEIPVLNVGSWEDTFNDLKVIYSKINHNFTTFSGEIACGAIDSWVHDSIFAMDHSLLNVHGDVFAVLYRRNSASMWLKTFDIDSDGNIGSLIDSWNLDAGVAQNGGFLKVLGSTNIFAVLKGVGWSNAEIVTFTIADDGTITKSYIDQYSRPSRSISGYSMETFTRVKGSEYAAIYEGFSGSARIEIFSISAGGLIGLVTQNGGAGYQYQLGADGLAPSIARLSEGVSVITYVTGSPSVVRVKLLSTGNTLAAELDSLDISAGDSIIYYYATPQIITDIDGFSGCLVGYGLHTSGGKLKAVSVTGGSSLALEDSEDLDTYVVHQRFLNALGNGVLVGYSGPPSVQPDFHLRSLKVESDGTITLIEKCNFTESGALGGSQYCALVNVDGSIYASARGATAAINTYKVQ